MERLSGLDATFLYVETPRMHMHVAIVAVLDPSDMPGGYSFEAVQSLIERQARGVPVLRRRLVQVPFHLHHPLWVDDPNFDIIHHVRRVACPAPGGLEELGALCGRIASTPLDRSRPLWEAWVIEGLEDGRFAVLCKIHHCAVDGASGAGLLVHLFSLTRDGKPLGAPVPLSKEEIPDDMDMVRYALASRIKQPPQIFKMVQETSRKFRELVERRQTPGTRHGATPFTAPRTHFNAAITAQRGAAFARISLDDAKRVKNAFKVTVNDVVLAVCAGALRRYLEQRGELPAAPLIAACPISIRTRASAGEVNNQISTMFTALATNLEDPVERLLAIRKVTRGAKEEHNAIGADFLQNWAEFASPTTFNLGARMYTHMKLADRHRPFHNVIVSNVPGPRFPLYLAGAKLVAAYPMGPVLEGAGLNITVMSYQDQLDFGFMVAAELVPDVWDLARAVEPSAAELLRAAEAKLAREDETTRA